MSYQPAYTNSPFTFYNGSIPVVNFISLKDMAKHLNEAAHHGKTEVCLDKLSKISNEYPSEYKECLKETLCTAVKMGHKKLVIETLRLSGSYVDPMDLIYDAVSFARKDILRFLLEKFDNKFSNEDLQLLSLYAKSEEQYDIYYYLLSTYALQRFDFLNVSPGEMRKFAKDNKN